MRLLNNHRFESNACLILKPGGGGGVVYKLQWGVAVTIAGSIDDQSKSKYINYYLKYIYLFSIKCNTHCVKKTIDVNVVTQMDYFVALY